MWKNYLKVSIRNLAKDKLYSLVNILGFSIGITCCALIYLYVNYELGFDKQHEKADRICRVTTVIYNPDKIDRFAPTSPMVTSSIMNEFPEIEKGVRFNFSSRILSYKEKKFPEIKIMYSDSTLFDIFSFDLVEGEIKNSLNKPYSIVLTESVARKYFGSEPAYGKLMKLSDTINLTVTAVIKDIVPQSHFRFDCLLSRVTMNEMNKNSEDWIQSSERNWFNCNTFGYILLKPGTNYENFEKKVNAYMNKSMQPEKESYGMWINVHLQPLTDIHLNSHLEAEMQGTSNGYIEYIYIFIGTAFLMLVIACCNFINLSTAKSINRSKEIGLRKVIGATRFQLLWQFLGESIFFTFVSGCISIVIVVLILPYFAVFTNMDLQLNFYFVCMYIAILLAVGILSGLYPAVLMSSFSPIRSLKGVLKHGIADILFRKGLVVFQFSIAVALIICTLVVLNQLSYLQNRNIGFNREQLLNIKLKPQDHDKINNILAELRKNSTVQQATTNSFSFSYSSNITLQPEGVPDNELTSCNVFSADEDFFSTYQIPLVAGRDFSKKFTTDPNDAFIVNEAAVKAFGWKTSENAIGKNIKWGLGKEGKVIGVVKDFNFSSLKENIKPLLVHIFKPWFNQVTLRIKTDNIQQSITDIEKVWNATAVNSPFEYSFVDEEFDSMYQSEQKMKTILSTFTFLSILVACLGLFGLASFTIKQRYREIGIRKILGANISTIVTQLSSDFLKLVAIAILIAIPVAWYASSVWLQDFAYKAGIPFWLFVLSGISAMMIAFLTVCIQAIQAASANPVKSLRTE